MALCTKILIIEDDPPVLNTLEMFFTDCGYEVLTANDGKEGLELFRKETPEIILTDLRMPVLDGIEVIKAVIKTSPDTPIIVISGTSTVKDAVDALRFGAWDYVEKPVHDLDALERMVCKALGHRKLQNEVTSLKQQLLAGGVSNPEIFSSIITRTPSVFNIFQYIEVIARTTYPVLICGETGSGKELFANAIHAASGRKGKMVALNAAGLDDHMFSDTLFGHIKGAFTGADKPRDGLISQAAGGTLFLDEIGDLNETIQIKLLRLLQEGEYHPLGSDSAYNSDARIVLATHRNLLDMIDKGTFRKDLYYRLFAHQTIIPPLRERPDDIALLLEKFLQDAAESLGKKKPTYPPELLGYLKSHDFPGNVRELKAMVYEAVTRHTSGILSMGTFLETIHTITPPSSRAAAMKTDVQVFIRDANGERMPTIDEAEEALITQAMSLANGNQGIAAGYLGVTRTALNKKLAKRRYHP